MRSLYKSILIKLILLFFPLAIFAQGKGFVKGKLVDDSNDEALIYANVAVQGTAFGTVTDGKGNFRFALPSGGYELVLSYLSYHTTRIKVQIISGETNDIGTIKLKLEAILGEEIVVTAMLRGQVAAINEQVKAKTIVNVVSKEKIQELPDANAAEAIARLPGVSVQRDAGEGSKIVVRGLSPRFSSITINGERIPSTDPNDRSVDLSMISVDMLEGMEVFKALTADKDADAIGGTVNFVVKKADAGWHGTLRAQTGYNSHMNEFGQNKFAFGIGNRFFDNKFGIHLTGNYERRNRSSDLLEVSYTWGGVIDDVPQILVNNMNLVDRIEIRKRYGGSLTLDYDLNNGSIVLNSSLSQTDRDEVRRRKRYRLGSWYTEYDLRDRDINKFMSSNVLSGSHTIFDDVKFTWRTSYSSSMNNTPYSHYARFRELAAFTSDITENKGPDYIPPGAKNNLDETFFKYSQFDENFVKDQSITAQLDLEIPITFSEKVAGYVKFGGKYRDNYRERDNFRYWTSHFGINDLAADIPDLWELTSEGKLAISNYIDPDCTAGENYLQGRYDFGPCLDREGLRKFGEDFRDYQLNGSPLYINEPTVELEDYKAGEKIFAGYVMAEINFGEKIVFIPGIRFEQTNNNYESVFGNPFVDEDGEGDNIGSLTDTTGGQNYYEFLPMIHLRYKPLSWFDVRLAYTKTLARPDFFNLVPWRRIVHFDQSIEQGNPALKHTVADNYDLFLSFYNKLGLFTIGGFYKELENIDYIRTSRISGGEYHGYKLTEPENAEQTTRIKGVEIELQTNLRYLPKPLDGIVLYFNYSRIFSETVFPFFMIGPRSPDPPYRPIIIDTIRIGRMPGQADYILNFSIGYEKGGFSGRVSYVYQGSSLRTIGTRYEFDSFDGAYSRLDLALRQKFKNGLSIYFNMNNITNKAETAFIGNGFDSRIEFFGWAADLGLRFDF